MNSMLKEVMTYGEFEIYVNLDTRKYVAFGLGWEAQASSLDGILEKCDKRMADVKKSF